MGCSCSPLTMCMVWNQTLCCTITNYTDKMPVILSYVFESTEMANVFSSLKLFFRGGDQLQQGLSPTLYIKLNPLAMWSPVPLGGRVTCLRQSLNLLEELSGKEARHSKTPYTRKHSRIHILYSPEDWCRFSSRSSENLSEESGRKRGISLFSGITDSFSEASEQQ